MEITLKTIQAEPHQCVHLTAGCPSGLAADGKSRRPALKRQAFVESVGASGSVPATPTNEIPTMNVVDGSSTMATMPKLQVYIVLGAHKLEVIFCSYRPFSRDITSLPCAHWLADLVYSCNIQKHRASINTMAFTLKCVLYRYWLRTIHSALVKIPVQRPISIVFRVHQHGYNLRKGGGNMWKMGLLMTYMWMKKVYWLITCTCMHNDSKVYMDGLTRACLC